MSLVLAWFVFLQGRGRHVLRSLVECKVSHAFRLSFFSALMLASCSKERTFGELSRPQDLLNKCREICDSLAAGDLNLRNLESSYLFLERTVTRCLLVFIILLCSEAAFRHSCASVAQADRFYSIAAFV